MNKLALIAALLVPLAVAGCDDEEDKGGDTTMSMDSATSSMMTEEVCMSSHECVGDACMCTTEGMEGEACTDDTMCEDECEVCVTQ